MTTKDILTLTQWLSPSFPVGAFAYSHGLEVAIQDGRIASAVHLEDWLSDVLEHGTGINDCILLRAAYGALGPDVLASINDTALAVAASSERVLETQLQGDAFCKTSTAIWGGNDVSYTYPVAVGAAAACLNIDSTLTATLYLHAFVSNLVSAAVRLVPLGQTDGQTVLATLAPLCESIAARSDVLSLDDLQSMAFLSDIAAMHHETLQPRIFRS